HRLVASQGLPLHRGEPEAPYLRTLAPAIYALFGVDETYEFMARTLGEDPAPLIEAGTSSDDWLRRVSDAFSLVCELPYYTAPGRSTRRRAGRSPTCCTWARCVGWRRWWASGVSPGSCAPGSPRSPARSSARARSASFPYDRWLPSRREPGSSPWRRSNRGPPATRARSGCG